MDILKFIRVKTPYHLIRNKGEKPETRNNKNAMKNKNNIGQESRVDPFKV